MELKVVIIKHLHFLKAATLFNQGTRYQLPEQLFQIGCNTKLGRVPRVLQDPNPQGYIRYSSTPLGLSGFQLRHNREQPQALITMGMAVSAQHSPAPTKNSSLLLSSTAPSASSKAQRHQYPCTQRALSQKLPHTPD